MNSYRLVYILLAVCALAFSQVYAGHLSSVVLITVLALPVLSLSIAVIQRFAFKLIFDNKPQSVERGDNLRLQIMAQNRFIFPCSNAFITAEMPSTSSQRSARLIFSMFPLCKKKLFLTYEAKYRGEYELKLKQVFFYDFLKLFKIKKTLNLSKKILVLPKLYDQISTNPFSVSSDEESSVQMRSTNGTERSFIRKYADGDDVRQIHWKLSSKQDEYMVWQPAKSRTVENLIICDMTRKNLLLPKKENIGKKSKKNPEENLPGFGKAEQENAVLTDAVIEVALAAALYNVKSDRKSFISFYDKAAEKNAVLSAGTLPQIYQASEIAARADSYFGQPDFFDEAKNQFLNNSGKGVLIITHCGDMKTVRLAEHLRAMSEIGIIVVGEPEPKAKIALEALSGISFAAVDPLNLAAEIPAAISKIYKA